MVLQDWSSYATGRGYMASPYTLLPPTEAVAHAKHWLTLLSNELGPGTPLFSPVVHQQGMDVDWTHDQWMTFCIATLSGCSFLIIPPVPGREDSKGIAREVAYARGRNMTVLWLPTGDSL